MIPSRLEVGIALPDCYPIRTFKLVDLDSEQFSDYRLLYPI